MCGEHFVELAPHRGRRVIPRINVVGLARSDIRKVEAHDDRLLTAETAATQPKPSTMQRSTTKRSTALRARKGFGRSVASG